MEPKANKLTLEDLEAQISGEYYFTAGQGAKQALADLPEGRLVSAMLPSAALDYVTVCVLIANNGYTFVGINHGPADPTEFSAEDAHKYARAHAISQMWPVLGYELKTRLHQEHAKV